MNCERCGIEFSRTLIYAREKRGNDSKMCFDCEHLEKPFASNVHNQCRAWSGEVDDEFNPIRNGKLYMPGLRLCGRKDCVKKSHIEKVEIVAEVEQKPILVVQKVDKRLEPKPEVKHSVLTTKKAPMKRPMTFDELLTVEQFDISYRTGKPLDFQQLMHVLKTEGMKG